MEIKVRGVNKIKAKGRIYYYHRPTGTRIHAEFGSSAFLAELEVIKGIVARVHPGTLGAIIMAYKQAPEFTGLADRTKADYNRVFDYLAVLHDMPLPEIDAPFLLELRDKAAAARKRRFANYCVQVLRLLLEWARARRHVDTNVARDVALIRRPRTMPAANRPWTTAERYTVLEAAPAALKPIIALGMFAGLREGDAVRFAWSGYDGRGISLIQGKTGDPVWIPAHRELREILDGIKRKSPVVALNRSSRPFTVSGFRSSFFKLLGKLEQRSAIGPKLTFHGLRHTLATVLAEAGCDEQTMAAVLGHKSTAMTAHYARRAQTKKRAVAAIKTLERKGGGFAKR